MLFRSLEGSRFKVQADDFIQAQAFAERVNGRFANCVFTFLASDGQHIECRGGGFSYALGINEDDSMDAFRGRTAVAQRRRYMHKSPDCLRKIEELPKSRHPLVAFHIPPKLKGR